MEFTKPRGASFAGLPRRVFTAPIQSTAPPSSSASSSSQSDNGVVDTLYDHPNVKIVSFTAGSHPLTLGPRAGTAPDSEPGSLAWSNQLERTIAAGAFRIYRAPGSVAFLSCGAALQPILPKSQAWCVDEESSKYILQIRRPQYWRIEVPVEHDEDKQRAQVLREVLDKILQFEKTECPFQRSFTVELPERPQAPVIKKPWTPVRRSSACLPIRPVTPVEVAHVHRGPPNRPRGSICMGDLRTTDPSALSERRRSSAALSETAEPSIPEHDASPVTKPTEAALRPNPIKINKTDDGGPVTPPQLAMLTPPTSHSKAGHSTELPRRVELKSPVESLQSQSVWRSSLPPSPPQSNPGSPVISVSPANEPSRTAAPREASQLRVASVWSTTSADSAEDTERSSVTGSSSIQEIEQSATENRPSSPYINFPEEAVEDGPEHEFLAASGLSYSTSSSPVARRPLVRRATTSSSISPDRRALSPLPSAADLFAPRHQSPKKHNTSPVASLRGLPMSVIHKTCEILMSPPSHLINLMLKVAARIAAGEWRGLVFGTGEDGERIPVQWDYSDEEYSRLRPSTAQPGSQRSRGWSRTHDDHDWWLKKRSSKDKMAGTFPESDDEDVCPLDKGSTKSNGSGDVD
ncbi:inheritance of peroxisomes protein 1-domain-containing protein [Podospora fimiseda]|uniref:Inheritance of peroxisomes protein 1 n=1 Tax=Podospora fimiseda TaxID=252190 RepID=A0AAN7BSD8_9PEZI|nr:inheritance of peroxisomes protein 1-domain-containing protein [Podospora fimiseda]